MEKELDDWRDRIYLGDCVDGLNSLPSEGGQVDLAFADPPYNIGYRYDVYDDRLEDAAYLAWTERWVKAVARVLTASGALWVAIGDEYAAEVKRIVETAGLTLRNWVIWYYTFGVHCTHKFSRSHTHLLYFLKNPSRFTFNDQDIRVRSARQLVYSDARADRRGRVPDNTWILRPQDARGAFRPEHDTWYFPRIAGTFKQRAGFHSCQMPEQLLARIVRCCSNAGDVVLDPFAGSGSTLIVAKKLGRHWVGYELSPEYARHAEARIGAVRQGDALEGPRDPLSSAPATPLSFQRRQDLVDEQGLVEAFRRSSDGFASDRLIADPVLNAAFIDQCSKLGLSGRPRDWNLSLLALRKSGKLTGVPTTKRTQFSWGDMDPFLFASEIALRRMLDIGYPSLDDVLCDPSAASHFDEIARAFAPGFISLDYRWGALRLRKDARLWRRSSQRLPQPFVAGNPRRVALEESQIAPLETVPAVYLLSMVGEKRKEAQVVYAGETQNIVERATRTLHAQAALDRFLPNTGRWQLDLFDLRERDADVRRGHQSQLIGRKRPVMNYLDLACQGS